MVNVRSPAAGGRGFFSVGTESDKRFIDHRQRAPHSSAPHIRRPACAAHHIHSVRFHAKMPVLSGEGVEPGSRTSYLHAERTRHARRLIWEVVGGAGHPSWIPRCRRLRKGYLKHADVAIAGCSTVPARKGAYSCVK